MRIQLAMLRSIGRCTVGLLLAAAWTAAPGARAEDMSGSIQIKGSDTMVNLTQAWAEAFMTKHPGVSIAVTGGGSGTGIAALISGTADLAASSRKITPKELSAAKAQGASPEELTVALDGLAVVVHPSNPARQLTLQQLADIFMGKTTSWDAAGGSKKPIVILSREVNSGTHVYFKEHVLGAGNEFAPEALLMPSSQAIAEEVAGNPAAIGYYGMGYNNERNALLAVARDASGPFVSPNEQTVRDESYPISRPLFIYTRGEPAGAVKAFLEFAQSAEGQEVVRQNDFVPVAAR